ncbi:CopD family protein [Psychrobacter alimentarius]|uniref:CopD family protein n=1 Tax=Psychrobacter alimentarius TaxID=261164 RepID=UPI00191A0242|nr:CopD family protein [Psychrobacter alimentarius]
MIYSILKAVHIIAMVIWIAGMSTICLYFSKPNIEFLKTLKSYDRMVTTPAMLLVWIFGILLAVQGGWFGSGWLWAKLFLVLIMSCLHGMLTGRLRRHSIDLDVKVEPKAQTLLLIGLILFVGIVILVTTKLF